MYNVNAIHIPVLLEETMHHFVVSSDGTYVDATFGRGGHTIAILGRLNQKGGVIAFDRDQDAIDYATQLLGNETRFTAIHASFSKMQICLIEQHVFGKIAGILFDLGVSSPQLEEARRGFCFSKDGPLDMRMDMTQTLNAAEWLATVDEKTLTHALWQYGEERFAPKIARKIILERKKAKISTTFHLVDLIKRAMPKHPRHKHPATRTFQAIRIVVNQEMTELHMGLQQAMDSLAIGGRLAVISFHSLEDRLVKQFMHQYSVPPMLPNKLPIKSITFKARLKMITKAIKPNVREIEKNPRARSAILRIAEKIS